MITTELPSAQTCLVDTNVLLRLAQGAPLYPAQSLAMEALLTRGNRLVTTFQNIAEFWNVSTRPIHVNGRGLSPEQARRQTNTLELAFEILTEDEATYNIWSRLLTDYSISGRQVHDARLVAHMLNHNIPFLLTSNTKDFVRYPLVRLIDPENLL